MESTSALPSCENRTAACPPSAGRTEVPSWWRTASAIGIIIAAVAVLDIHIEMNAVEHMKPRSSRGGRAPNSMSTRRAMRFCRWTASSAAATTRPPKKRTILSLK